MRTAITAARMLTPLETIAPAIVVVEDGRILRAGSPIEIEEGANTTLRDFGDATLAPGLVDIHVHGGGGHDAMEATPAALWAIGRHLQSHGVTAFCPTTMTAPWTATLATVEQLGKTIAAADGAAPGAQPLGIHLEGPFLSAAQAGVHPGGELLDPDPARFDALWEAAGGHIALLTLAPELPGAEALIRRATARGVAVSLGHSDGGREATLAAIAAGARHFTHTFNAMRPLRHRDPGILGEALMNAHCSADIIADGVHVDPMLVAMFLRLKGPERAVLISDAIAAAGCGDGRYRLGPIEVDVSESRCSAGGRLAGSVLALDRAVRNVMEFGGSSLAMAVRAASYNPARLLTAAGRKGMLAAGADADLIVLNAAGELRAVMTRGRWVDEAGWTN